MLAISPLQSLYVPFGQQSFLDTAVNSQGFSLSGWSSARSKNGTYDFYPMSAPFDEPFTTGSKVWVYVGTAQIRSWIPGIIMDEIPPRYFNNVEVHPRSYTVSFLPTRIGMEMYKDNYLSRFMTPNQSFANPPEGAVFVPQYGDVKPHCGHTLMLLLLQDYYNMRELRFFCRGFNRALLQMGFKINESDLTPKQSISDLMSCGFEAVFNKTNNGRSVTRVSVEDENQAKIEMAMEE